MSAQDDLIKQILASSDKSKWTGQGYGSAEKNAADMARIMAGIGITDVKQFGKVPTYEKAITVRLLNKMKMVTILLVLIVVLIKKVAQLALGKI